MNKKSQDELITELAELVEQLGWVIGMPDGDGMVPGLIIGEKEYVEEVVEAYYGPGFTTFEQGIDGNMVESPPSKKTTLH